MRAHVPTRLARRLLRVEALESRNAPGSLAWSTGLLLAAEDPWVSPLTLLDARPQAAQPSGSHSELVSPAATSPLFEIQVTAGPDAAPSAPQPAPENRPAPAAFAATNLDPEALDDLLAAAFEGFSDPAFAAPPRAAVGNARSGNTGDPSRAAAEGGGGAESGTTPGSPGPATGSWTGPAAEVVAPRSVDTDAALALLVGPVSGSGPAPGGVPSVPTASATLPSPSPIRPLALDGPAPTSPATASAGPIGLFSHTGSGGTDPLPVATPPSDWSCQEDLIETAEGLPLKVPDTSANPVRYFDGTVQVQLRTLGSEGYGKFWGQTRSWTNGTGYASTSFYGTGMVVSELPYLRQNTAATAVAAISNGTTARQFDKVGSTYNPRFYLQETLAADPTPGEFILTDSTGNTLRFLDFSTRRPANERGQFKSLKDPAGNMTTVISRTADGKPAELQRSTTVGGVTTTESMQYSYLTAGTNAGLMDKVILRRQVNGGAWAIVRQEEYTYYETEANGSPGDLKLAVLKDGAGTVLDTLYFRYYTTDSAVGYAHGLKYFFSHASYARLLAAFPDPTSASDAEVAPYADLYLEFDASRRVTKEVVQGAGCSSCGAGQGTYTYSYATSSHADGYNSWKYKTTETLPDGNQNLVYSNYAGEVMLKVFHEVSSGRKWATFTKYDSAGRPLWRALPSAVSGYDDTKPDLLDSVNGNYQHLRDSAGLIETTAYYTSTTATETTPGGVSGYFQERKLQRGETGTAVLQETRQYWVHSGGGATVYPVASATVYRNTNGTGAQTTSLSYTWFASSTQMQSLTLSKPVISTAQNGPGTADVDTIYLDTYGRPIWHKDGDGFLHFTAFDPGSGAITKSIRDVDTSRTSDFTDLPAGWVTPTGGGLHLITQQEIDSLGRMTKLTLPNGNFSYTVYNDANHELRHYPGWDTTTNRPTGPTQVLRADRPGGYLETLTMSATPAVSNNRPTGTEAIGSLQTLARDYTNTGGQSVRRDAYFNLAGLTYSTALYLGTAGTHFYTALTDYDKRGRIERSVSPTGTITRWVFDGLSRVESTWVGTNDTPPSGSWSPTNNGAPANMVQVRENVYDAGLVGDSNLTQVTLYPGGPAAARVTQNFFDWRNRLVASKSGVQATETDTGTQRPIFYLEYDNLDQVTVQRQYDGDGVTSSDSNNDGVPDLPSGTLLRAFSANLFDNQGRVYRTQTYLVNQSTGGIFATPLRSDVWFGRRGQVLKTSQPGGLVQKQPYDGAGRPVTSFVSDGGGDTSWTDAGTVTGDLVLSQTESQYDANSNVIFVTTKERFHDETATGALNNASSAPKARVSYTAMYYDLADRPTHEVQVGSNGGTAYTRPGTPPARSDTVLVQSVSYNAAGWVETTTDPRALVGKTFYDHLGRPIKTIAGFVTGLPGTNADKITELTYDGSDHLLTVQANLPSGGYQKTQYVYGVSTATGSAVNSNDVLAAVKYPDKTTGNPSDSPKESYTVNTLGERTTRTDRNGSVHSYSYDVVGRFTADAVTPGTGVNGAVRRLQVGYDTAGRPDLYTSYDAASGGNVVNQVQQVYNGLGQLITEYQAHAGVVNTGTTPKVQYAYSTMAGGANHSRLTSLTYPNSRVLTANYATGLDNTISRLSSLTDGATTLEAYSYLGLGTVVKRAHPQPGVDLTYVKQGAEPNGDAGDQYTGLDRFGRVVDQRWLVTANGTHTDRFQYGHDRDGNRLYRDNLLNNNFDELYHTNGSLGGYDQLNQLTEFRRGALSDSNGDGIPDVVATASRSQVWEFDGQGNWSTLTSDGQMQFRTHNQQNQITALSGQTTPAYDSNGNVTTDPSGKTLVWDAWNQLKEVKQGQTTLVSYNYDALGRRITENAGTLKDLYYSAAWQVLEEREGSLVRAQYVWSPVYVDALILRDRDTNGDGSLEERLYVHQDANWNVTAVINSAGAVQERYVEDPYGQPTVLAPDWTTRVSSLFAWSYLHQGGRYESVSGLYHFRNRDYSPALGRWMGIDPRGLAAGDTNFYGYVHNAPINATDALGLQGIRSYPRDPYATPPLMGYMGGIHSMPVTGPGSPRCRIAEAALITAPKYYADAIYTGLDRGPVDWVRGGGDLIRSIQAGIYMEVTGKPWTPDYKSYMARELPPAYKPYEQWRYYQQLQGQNLIEGVFALGARGLTTRPFMRSTLHGQSEWIVRDIRFAQQEVARLQAEYARLTGRTPDVIPRPAGVTRDAGIDIRTGRIFVYDDVPPAFRQGYLAEELHHYFQLRERNLLGARSLPPEIEKAIEAEVAQRLRESGFIPYDPRNYAPYTDVPRPPGVFERRN